VFVLIAYDVAERRTEKYRKLLSRYLMNAQFSVFLGDLTDVKYHELQSGIERLMHEQDRVLVVSTLNRRNVRVEHWDYQGMHIDTNHLGSGIL